jgi:hypothetical protein
MVIGMLVFFGLLSFSLGDETGNHAEGLHSFRWAKNGPCTYE